jgi:hypothetical protein
MAAEVMSCKWCGKDVMWDDNPAIARCMPSCEKRNSEDLFEAIDKL